MCRWAVGVMLLVVLAVPGTARADAGITFSLAEGVTTGDWRATPLNAEATVYYQVWWVKLDLALSFNLEGWYDDAAADFFFFRPGIRFDFPRILFARVAVPLEFINEFNWGFLLGVGRNVIQLSALSIYLEVDASVTANSNWFERVPIELRVGLEVEF